MTKLSHQLQGLFFSASVFLFTHNPVHSFFFYIGNSFPDIDVLWNDMSAYKSKWYAHRGVTHSILIPLFLFAVSICLLTAEKLMIVPEVSFYSSSLLSFSLSAGSCLFFFALGYANHLLFDSMSPSGIPKKLSYYPRFKLWTLYRVGSLQEVLLLAVSILTVLSFSILFNLSYIKQLTSIILYAILCHRI